MISKSLSRLLRLAPVAGAAALLVPITAMASTTSIQPTAATLVAKGIAVDVSVTFTCPAGDQLGFFGFPGLSITVQQAVSKTQQAAGQGYASGQCSGAVQTDVVRVVANSAPYRTGPALVSTNLEACDTLGNCVFASSNNVVFRITN